MASRGMKYGISICRSVPPSSPQRNDAGDTRPFVTNQLHRRLRWGVVLVLHTLTIGVTTGSLVGGEPNQRQLLEAFQKQLQAAIESAGPSVVTVIASRSDRYPPLAADTPPGRLGGFDPREFLKSDASLARARLARYLDLSDPQAAIDHGYAAGVVLDSSGLILTLYHVIDGARKVYVHTAQGGSYADIHAADARSDLAVLRLLQPPDGLRPIRFADVLLYDLPDRKATLAAGRLVVLLAPALRGELRLERPSGAFGSLTNVRHRLSLLHGELGTAPLEKQSSYYKSGVLLEHDVRPFADTSGAALVNLDGELLGLVTAQAIVYDRAIGPGYALPADEHFRRIVEVLRRGEEVEYGFLGVTLADNRPRLRHGVEIGSVNPRGPADLAGLRPGDIIIRINGYPVESYDDLLVHIGNSLAGSKVELTIQSPMGGLRTVTATLAKFYNSQPFIASKRPEPVMGLRVDYSSILTFRLRPPPLGSPIAIPAGVCIRDIIPDSPIDKKLRALGGDPERWLITHVNGQPVPNPPAFYAVCHGHKSLTLTLIDPLEARPRPRELIVP